MQIFRIQNLKFFIFIPLSTFHFKQKSFFFLAYVIYFLYLCTRKLINIMKTRQLFHAAMVAVSTLAMTAFVSCKENNTPDNPQIQPDTKPAAALMEVNVTLDDQFLELVTASFDFYDENGQKKNETLTGKTWSKKVKSAGLPAKLGFRMNLAAKEGVDRSQYTTFRAKYSFIVDAKLLNAAGEKIGTGQYAEGAPSQTFNINKFDTYLEAYAQSPLQTLYSYDADGKYKAIDWE